MASGEEREAGATGGVVLLVCQKCGREYQYQAVAEAPDDLTCDKCGNTVFRRFDATETPDEAQAEFREETERDLAADDPAGDATRGDLHDLNNP